jgi:hypothetical protein
MTITRVLCCSPALIALLAQSVACAQVFTVPPNPFPQAPRGAGAEKRQRLQFGAYLALWDFAPIAAPGAESERVDADSSPLVTADYSLTRSWSLGGWWNPLQGDLLAKPATGPQFKAAAFDASFWNVHATYYLPEKWAPGWSAQAGFSQLHYDVDVIQALRAVGAKNFGVTFSSLNIWVNKSQEVGTRRVHGRRRPISLFGSFGYYTSSQFDRALNVILGGALPLSPHLRLSSSVWFNDLDDLNTRVTVGLDGDF